MAQHRASTRGFTRADRLLNGHIRRASETRGFAQSRLLTQWAEIAGAWVSAIAHPVEVSYGREGFGATLTLLTTGAQAPMLEMEKEKLRTRVNTVYGYNAIARIRITQTAPTGFAEGRVAFEHLSEEAPARFGSDPKSRVAAERAAAPVTDSDLRTALVRLGEHVLNKSHG
ncbi:MAG: DciA family protein [Pseudomonadota bacterium]